MNKLKALLNLFGERRRYKIVKDILKNEELQPVDKYKILYIFISEINRNYFDTIFKDIETVHGIKFEQVASGRNNIFILHNFTRCKKTALNKFPI